jgi:hypothetical protein
LKQKNDEPLSDFALNFNLRRYTWGGMSSPRRQTMGAAARGGSNRFR